MILVTGSDGIVGRELCRKLQELVMPFLPVTHRRKPHTLQQALQGDLVNDVGLLEGYLHEISAIVHLAAAVPHSVSYPDNDASADFTRRMDRNIRHIQVQLGVPVIYMSTCGLYDRSVADIKHEADPSQVIATSPYFAVKAEGEDMFLSGGGSTVLRLAAPIGPGLKPQLVLSRFIATARESGTIRIWGNGTREQDFIDTADVADLIVRILDYPKTLILNVASGAPTTMSYLAETVVSVIGAGSIEKTTQNDPRDGETARYSIERAKEHYKWSPARTLAHSIANIALEDFEANS
jgi:nucleoside-diphosphate-sugar epimerase